MRLPLPSVRAVYVDACVSARRFPAVLAFSFSAGLVAVLAAGSNDAFLYRLEAALLLGIALAFALGSAAEVRGGNATWRAAAVLVTLALVLAFFVSFPLQTRTTYGLRFVQFDLAAHLLVAFSPYIAAAGWSGFWEYNQRLFVRFVTAVCFSAALYVGLAIALGSTQYLFGIPKTATTYWHVWVVVAFGFNTWFFLAGVPAVLPRELEPGGYPRSLRVFTQYILIPLVTLYVLILYAFMMKIGITHTWPEGTVAYLVASFSVLGIFTLLLVRPMHDVAESRWVATYSRSFYLALFPLIGLLVLATGRRVSDYGITERRYFLFALAAWLAGIASYFTVSRRKDIRVVPISLCVVALLTALGPWDAYSVARRSQLARLTRILEAHGILVNGRIEKVGGEIDFETRKSLASILDYLNTVHGGAGIERWFEPGALGQPPFDRSRSMTMMAAMGMDYVSPWQTVDQEKPFSFYSELFRANEGVPVLPIAGYEGLVRVALLPSSTPSVVQLSWSGRTVHISLRADGPALIIADGRSEIVAELGPLLDDLGQGGTSPFPAERMSLAVQSPSLRAKVYLIRLEGSSSDRGPRVAVVEADVLLRTAD